MTEDIKLTVPRDEVDQRLEEAQERYYRLDDLVTGLMDRGDGIGLYPYREEIKDIGFELKEVEGRIEVLQWIQDENRHVYSDFEYSFIDFLKDIAQHIIGFITPSSEETAEDPVTVDRKKIRFDEV